MAQKNILIVCGEPSGDLNAARLAEKILEINPKIRISGVGGNLLRKAGAEIYCDIKDLAVMGLFDVLKKLPKFLSLKELILKKIALTKPDLVILVDFSGFNLRLAKAINNSIPVFYYVSPQVWASRPGRIKTIKRFIRKMIVLFKFEEEFYAQNAVGVNFTGHPLVDIVKPAKTKKEFFEITNLNESKTTIALLPGSRKAEIINILPLMIKAAELIIQSAKETQFVIAKSTNVEWEVYNRFIKNKKIEVRIIEGKTYDCLNIADFAFVCSGTATLETAIMQKPFFIIYKMNLLNYLLYRPQVKLPYIGMVNIVAGKKIIPEFIQFQADPKQIAQETLKILNDPDQLAKMNNDLSQIKSSLGPAGASLRAAQIITDFLNK